MMHIESPRTDDAGVEQLLQTRGVTAPRITPADIEAAIASEHYFTAADGVVGSTGSGIVAGYQYPGLLDLMTFCVLIMRNGFRVVGVNEGPVSAETFDAELGRKMARQKALDQIWPLMGYQLRSAVHEASTQTCAAIATRAGTAGGA